VVACEDHNNCKGQHGDTHAHGIDDSRGRKEPYHLEVGDVRKVPDRDRCDGKHHDTYSNSHQNALSSPSTIPLIEGTPHT